MTMELHEKSTAEDIRLAKILPGNMYLGGADTVRFVNLESLSWFADCTVLRRCPLC
jgi:hypothetical protein